MPKFQVILSGKTYRITAENADDAWLKVFMKAGKGNRLNAAIGIINGVVDDLNKEGRHHEAEELHHSVETLEEWVEVN